MHEFRTPISVVAGYIHMLLKDPTATFDERHRRWLEEAQKSCVRLAKIVTEMSELSRLEAGRAPLKRAPLDLHQLLTEVVAAVADVPDRKADPDGADRIVEVELEPDPNPAQILGEATRLRTALTSLIQGLRREVVSSDRLFVRERIGTYKGKPASWIAIAEAQHIETLAATGPDSLATFDEWRGGCGLGLPFARRVIEGHDGAIWSPGQGTKAGAVLVLPHA